MDSASTSYCSPCQQHNETSRHPTKFLAAFEEQQGLQREALAAMREVCKQLQLLQQSSEAGPREEPENETLLKVAEQAPSAGMQRYLQCMSRQQPDASALSDSIQRLAALRQCRQPLQQMRELLAEMQETIQQRCDWGNPTERINSNAQRPCSDSEEAMASSETVSPPSVETTHANEVVHEEVNSSRLAGAWPSSRNCVVADCAVILAAVMDMVEKDHHMQITAWQEVGPDIDPDQLSSYIWFCELQPFFDPWLLEEARAWVDKASEEPTSRSEAD